jgi:hypothetical protein
MPKAAFGFVGKNVRQLSGAKPVLRRSPELRIE